MLCDFGSRIWKLVFSQRRVDVCLGVLFFVNSIFLIMWGDDFFVLLVGFKFWMFEDYV